MRKKAFATAGALLAAPVGLVALSAPPAFAGPDLLRCKSGEVCIYKGSLADRDLKAHDPVSVGRFKFEANSTYYVVNNGNYEPHQDHYYFAINYNNPYCLPYNRVSPVQLDAVKKVTTGPAHSYITGQYWGGAC